MKLSFKTIFLLAVLTAPVVMFAQTTINAKLDSAMLLMGRTTALHLDIVQPATAVGQLLADRTDTIHARVEIADRPKADTTDLGNGRIQIKRDLIVQSFDSGLYVIGPLAYVVGGDTFLTNKVTINVIPVKVDTTKAIVDFKPVATVPFKFFDWVPDIISDYWWAWLLGILLLAAALFYYIRYYRRGKKNPFHIERKRLPPYEEAMGALRALKSRNLWQNGQEKAYYTELTDILRVYIDRRFGVNAVEMTTSQIIDTLQHNEETQMVNDQLNLILEMADFVKFAAMRPLADDNEVAYQRALNFVEATKPLPQPEVKQARKEVQS